jgi:hypothetical protein
MPGNTGVMDEKPDKLETTEIGKQSLIKPEICFFIKQLLNYKILNNSIEPFLSFPKNNWQYKQEKEMDQMDYDTGSAEFNNQLPCRRDCENQLHHE